ncbi:MAG: hypothetical protein ACE5GA_02435 [Candidatus Zixiibacteriota bacterium]
MNTTAISSFADSAPSDSATLLRRSLRMTAALLLLGSLYILVRIDAWDALAFLSAGAWSLVNMLFLSATVRATIKPGKVDFLAVAGLLLVKFPALYLAGYFLLSFDKFDTMYMFAGFSVFFAVLLLKTIGRAVMRIESPDSTANRESILK